MQKLDPEYPIPLSPITLAVLVALAYSQNTGYGITRQISEDSGSIMEVGSSTMYPALTRLENMGYISTPGAYPGSGPTGYSQVYHLTDRP